MQFHRFPNCLRRYGSIAALVALVLPALSSPDARAADETFCALYAATATAQHRQAAMHGCVILPPVWSADHAGHESWCRGVTQDIAEAGTRLRVDGLRACLPPGISPYGENTGCARYATRAVAAQAENVRRGCGNSGPEWSDDPLHHYGWCLGRPDAIRAAGTGLRDARLAGCARVPSVVEAPASRIPGIFPLPMVPDLLEPLQTVPLAVVGAAPVLHGPTDKPRQVRQETLYLPLRNGPSTVRYEIRDDGLAYMQGDIILGTASELDRLRRPPPAPRTTAPVDGIGTKTSPLVMRGSEYLWPGGVIPFRVDPGLSADIRKVILDGLGILERQTTLRFLPLRSGDPNWLDFVFEPDPKSCGSAKVGRRGSGQEVRIRSAGCGTGTVIHETLHALGMWHEQSRRDRDTYVEILWGNIIDGYDHNFEREDGSVAVGGYDFGSIMHYGAMAFGKRDPNTGATLPTIRSKIPGQAIGSGPNLTPADIAGVRAFYRDVACWKTPELFEDAGYAGKRIGARINIAHLDPRDDDEASAACVPTGYRVTLYEHPNYRGASLALTGPVFIGNLETQAPDGRDWSDMVSSIQVVGGASGNVASGECAEIPWLFQHSGFAGARVPVPQSLADLHATGFGDRASGVCIPPGWALRLYEHVNFGGQSVRVEGPMQIGNLHTQMSADWGDRISSVRLEQQAPFARCGSAPTLFEHANFGGARLPLAQKVANLHIPPHGFGDRVSSLCVPKGWAVTVFEHAGFAGAKIDVVGPRDMPAMPPGWNDRISSIDARYIDATFQ